MMMTMKTVAALITGPLLILMTPASRADNFSINIGYSNFGYHRGYLPYSYKPFSHPKTIYYSPLRPVYPRYYHYHGYPGYIINNYYYDNKPYHGHNNHHGNKHHSKGHDKYYYNNSYRGSYQRVPQKTDRHKK